MQQFVLTLKDDSKREFLLELLKSLEFVELKAKKNGKEAKPQSESSDQISFKWGSAKGLIGYVPDDFNEPLEDFKDYM